LRLPAWRAGQTDPMSPRVLCRRRRLGIDFARGDRGGGALVPALQPSYRDAEELLAEGGVRLPDDSRLDNRPINQHYRPSYDWYLATQESHVPEANNRGRTAPLAMTVMITAATLDAALLDTGKPSIGAGKVAAVNWVGTIYEYRPARAFELAPSPAARAMPGAPWPLRRSTRHRDICCRRRDVGPIGQSWSEQVR
jgi:hypothetical protein